MVVHTVRIIQHSGWGLEAAIQHSAAPRAVLSFLTPPLVLYYAYSMNNHAITIISCELSYTCHTHITQYINGSREAMGIIGGLEWTQFGVYKFRYIRTHVQTYCIYSNDEMQGVSHICDRA